MEQVAAPVPASSPIVYTIYSTLFNPSLEQVALSAVQVAAPIVYTMHSTVYI